MKRILLFLIITAGCNTSDTSLEQNKLPYDQPPLWSQEAIWYQIFVERFRNGDEKNDPNLLTMHGALTDSIPPDWSVTPWKHNWYLQEEWTKDSDLDFYRTIQMRRYGGDLQGVMDKIPYLLELGINAIYFNPLNDAPSLHKYDARSYHHIDVNFGPDPLGDLEIIALEDPNDPTTWEWTSADKLFLELLDSLHKYNIKVVLDFSWNHTGREFWAFKDIQKKGSASPYTEWYDGEIIKDSIGNEYYDYKGWYGMKSLPEWRKTDVEERISGHPYEGNLHNEVKQHIYNVSKRWMDPYDNGEVRRGIDGIRLDVAEQVPLGFWRDYRKFIREVNPEFYLVGENWWTNWPHELMDTKPWVKGDIFDAVMHYHWYKVARGYFAGTADKVSATEFGAKMDSVFGVHPEYTQKAMMNLGASHDSPRNLTSFFNKNVYKYQCKPQENPEYLTGKPDEDSFEKLKLFLLHQFTYIGSPHIWNGDEMGMWGADDPDNRKPLWWRDYSFDTETASEFSSYQYNDEIGFNETLFDYYKSLIKLRKDHVVLIHGTVTHLRTNPNLVIYKRKYKDEEIYVIFNNTNQIQESNLESPDGLKVIFKHCRNAEEELNLNLIPPQCGLVLRKDN